MGTLMDPKLQDLKTLGAIWVAAQDSGTMESSSPLPQPHSCLMPGAGAGSWGSLIQQAKAKQIITHELAPYELWPEARSSLKGSVSHGG